MLATEKKGGAGRWFLLQLDGAVSNFKAFRNKMDSVVKNLMDFIQTWVWAHFLGSTSWRQAPVSGGCGRT